MRQNTIELLIGMSGSGKSTFAASYVKKYDAVRINRDDIRSQLFGLSDGDHQAYYQEDGVHRKEKLVTDVQDRMIKAALKDRRDVVVDNTNLKISILENFKKYGKKINLHFFPCSIEHAKRSIKVRGYREIPEDVLEKQELQYQTLMNSQSEELEALASWQPPERGEERIKALKKREEKYEEFSVRRKHIPQAVICDLDGTLSIMKDRSPYDGHKCASDVVNEPIRELLLAQKNLNGANIILFSGRNSDRGGREATEKWLKDNHILYDKLIMREAGDNRPDDKVKLDMFNEIKDDYFIKFILDDRDQVVDLWRGLGLPCLQVHYGDF